MYWKSTKFAASLVVIGLVSTFALAAWASGPAAPKSTTKDQGKVTTLQGRVVDLACFMSDKYGSMDHQKCTAECIRAGVPCGLSTSSGLVVVGDGTRSPSSKLAPYAFQDVKVTGKYFERDGVRYLDMQKIEKVSQRTHVKRAPRKQK